MKRRWLGLVVLALLGMFSNLVTARTLTITVPPGTVHAGPGKNDKIVGKVTSTRQYEVLEERDDWYRIRLENGIEGWIAAEGVEREGVEREESRGIRSTSVPFGTVQQRFALVIGNGDYPSNPLRNAGNDANDIATLLRKLHFEVMLRLNADKRTMEEAIREFTAAAPLGSVGLFYFAGHGMQMAGENYLIPLGLPVGGQLQRSDIEYGAVKADWVLKRMEDARMDVKLIILDACRDNPVGRNFTRGEGGGLVPMAAVKGSLIAYATSPGKTALDGAERNSPYTTQLLRQLPEPGISVETMFKKVRIGVEQATRGAQIPWEHSSLMGEFYFVGGRDQVREDPRQFGSIEIVGRVAGVEVWIGSDKIGETRSGSTLRWENLQPGRYRVQGYKAGYASWEREVTVVANQRTEVILDITPLAAPPSPKSEPDKPRGEPQQPPKKPLIVAPTP